MPDDSAELLLNETRGEDHHREHLLVEPQLVVRESSLVRRRGIADGKGAP